jgi:hypothetical protein
VVEMKKRRKCPRGSVAHIKGTLQDIFQHSQCRGQNAGSCFKLTKKYDNFPRDRKGYMIRRKQALLEQLLVSYVLFCLFRQDLAM